MRLIVRDREKAEPFVARGAEVAVANLEDGAALAEALAGTQAAYLLLPTEYGAASGYVRRTMEMIESITSAVVAYSARHGHVIRQDAVGVPGTRSLFHSIGRRGNR